MLATAALRMVRLSKGLPGIKRKPHDFLNNKKYIYTGKYINTK